MELVSRYQGVNLYVKNLDEAINDDALRTEFARFGTITSAKVMTDGDGHSKGFGFVCYRSPAEATKAMNEMNGRVVASKRLYVALAQRREDRKAYLATQYMQRMPLGQFFNSGNIDASSVPQDQRSHFPQMTQIYTHPRSAAQPQMYNPGNVAVSFLPTSHQDQRTYFQQMNQMYTNPGCTAQTQIRPNTQTYVAFQEMQSSPLARATARPSGTTMQNDQQTGIASDTNVARLPSGVATARLATFSNKEAHGRYLHSVEF